MNKENVLHSFHGMLLSLKRGKEPVTYNNMDGPGGHYAYLESKRQVPYDLTLLTYLERSKSQRQKAKWWLLGPGMRGNGLIVSCVSFRFATKF